MKLYCDVVIVSGGIAGSALALVLARRGTNVAVLERQQDYADRVRGEYMHPWGVAEAQQLGLVDVLLGAGGVFATRAIGYDESIPSHVAEARRSVGGHMGRRSLRRGCGPDGGRRWLQRSSYRSGPLARLTRHKCSPRFSSPRSAGRRSLCCPTPRSAGSACDAFVSPAR